MIHTSVYISQWPEIQRLYMNSAAYLRNNVKKSTETCLQQNHCQHASPPPLYPYQEKALELLQEKEDQNCLLILPTGFWKSFIAFYEMLRNYKNGKKIFFFAPTNNLVQQQYEDFVSFLELLGEKHLIWKVQDEFEAEGDIFFLTQHSLKNPGILECMSHRNIHIIIDESHVWEKSDKSHAHFSSKAQNTLRQKNISLLCMTGSSDEQALVNWLWIDENNIIRLWSDIEYSQKNFYFRSIDIPENYSNTIKYIDEKISISQETLRKLLRILQKSLRVNSDNIMSIEQGIQELLATDFLKKENYNIPPEYKNKFLTHGKEWKKIIRFVKIIHLLCVIKTQLTQKSSKQNIEFLSKLQESYVSSSTKYKKKIAASWIFTDIQNLLQEDDTVIESWSETPPRENPIILDILKVASSHKPLLVFIDNKETIEHSLTIARKNGFKTSVLQSGKNTFSRQINSYTLQAIKNEDLDIIFTTSVAKLGINTPLDNLYLFELPKNRNDFLQLIGRVGRYGDKVGNIFLPAPELGNIGWRFWVLLEKSKKYLNRHFSLSDSGYQHKDSKGSKKIFSENIQTQHIQWKYSEQIHISAADSQSIVLEYRNQKVFGEDYNICWQMMQYINSGEEFIIKWRYKDTQISSQWDGLGQWLFDTNGNKIHHKIFSGNCCEVCKQEWEYYISCKNTQWNEVARIYWNWEDIEKLHKYIKKIRHNKIAIIGSYQVNSNGDTLLVGNLKENIYSVWIIQAPEKKKDRKQMEFEF